MVGLMKINFKIANRLARFLVFFVGLIASLIGLMQLIDPTWRLADDNSPSFQTDSLGWRWFYFFSCLVPLLFAISWNHLQRGIVFLFSCLTRRIQRSI